jgi:hypothetical protein
MPSLLFLLLALEASRDIFRNAAIRDGAALGLISTLAMTMSLENIYFLLLLPIVLLTRKSKPSLRRTAQLAGVVAAALPLGFLPLLAAARRTAGPDFYQDWAVDAAGAPTPRWLRTSVASWRFIRGPAGSPTRGPTSPASSGFSSCRSAPSRGGQP